MNDELQAISEAVAGIIVSLWTPERAAEQPGTLARDVWDALAQAQFTVLPVPEQLGGAGAGLPETAAVLVEAGRLGVPVPLAETALLASWLLALGGHPVPAEPLTAAVLSGHVVERVAGGYRLTGSLSRVPYGRAAERVVVLVDAPEPFAVSVRSADLTWISGRNVASEPRDSAVLNELAVPDSEVIDLAGRASVTKFQARGALGRALQMAGAMSAALQSSVTYTAQRVQFGRCVNRFQAVQQFLAEMAGETAATYVVATAAAAGQGIHIRDVAAAKVQAGHAATVVARRAHQMHGAIGFTEEHTLRHSTTRLWAWREEFGTARHWSRVLAEAACEADDLWEFLTEQKEGIVVG